jgi:hypothetical protein
LVEGASNTSRNVAATTTCWLALVKAGGYRSICCFATA